MYYNNLFGDIAQNFMRAMPSNNGSNQQAYTCYTHNTIFRYVCENCKMLICHICIRQDHAEHCFIRIDNFVSKSRNIIQWLLESCRVGANCIQNSVSKEIVYTRFIDDNCNELMHDIRNSFRPLVTALEERENFILKFVERLHQHRMNVLHKQMTALKSAYFELIDTAQMLQNLVETGYRMDNIAIAIKIVQGQNRVDRSAELLKDNQPQEELYKFDPPKFPNNILKNIYTQGSVELYNEAFTPNSNNTKTLDILSDLLADFNVCREQQSSKVKKKQGGTQERCIDGAIVPSNLRKSPRDVVFTGIGGEMNIGNGQAVSGWMEKVKAFRCDVPTLAFATKGIDDGQVSRPWGVCVNKSGHVFVTDRRINTVQAFAADGRFLYKFGKKGSSNGEFDAPMGICADKSGRLIVADKNNHRIQVFSSGGKFLLTFGGIGSKDGELKFPFDVAVNTNLQIVVADSANYRIQQFEHNGRFIRQIALGVYNLTGRDITPRGICYTPNGRIIITDYTNHCLHLVEVGSNKIVSTKGSQGTGNLQFNCPSGICCDDLGTIIVADSHNQRIKVFNSSLECLWNIDVRTSVNCLSMSYFNETDRTCDVALTRDGRIVFVTELLPAKEAEATAKRFVHVF